MDPWFGGGVCGARRRAYSEDFLRDEYKFLMNAL